MTVETIALIDGLTEKMTVMTDVPIDGRIAKMRAITAETIAPIAAKIVGTIAHEVETRGATQAPIRLTGTLIATTHAVKHQEANIGAVTTHATASAAST